MSVLRAPYETLWKQEPGEVQEAIKLSFLLKFYDSSKLYCNDADGGSSVTSASFSTQFWAVITLTGMKLIF